MEGGRFEGKVALVTGGASGIGRATALAFAREGARVVVGDVDVEGGTEVAETVAASGGEARFVRADVRSAAQVAALVGEAVAAFGGLDVAFNAAGVLPELGPVVEASEDDLDAVVAVNLKGTYLSVQEELRAMLPRGRGAIVNCASSAGLAGFPEAAAYSATKHAVVGLTRSVALEVASQGVRVNCVCPGPVRTPMLGAMPEEEAASGVPLGRVATPEEVADAVLWLASDGASYVTGHALAVDGGLLAW